jgi:hypothetical protein
MSEASSGGLGKSMFPDMSTNEMLGIRGRTSCMNLPARFVLENTNKSALSFNNIPIKAIKKYQKYQRAQNATKMLKG